MCGVVGEGGASGGIGRWRCGVEARVVVSVVAGGVSGWGWSFMFKVVVAWCEGGVVVKNVG